MKPKFWISAAYNLLQLVFAYINYSTLHADVQSNALADSCSAALRRRSAQDAQAHL